MECSFVPYPFEEIIKIPEGENSSLDSANISQIEELFSVEMDDFKIILDSLSLKIIAAILCLITI